MDECKVAENSEANSESNERDTVDPETILNDSTDGVGDLVRYRSISTARWELYQHYGEEAISVDREPFEPSYPLRYLSVSKHEAGHHQHDLYGSGQIEAMCVGTQWWCIDICVCGCRWIDYDEDEWCCNDGNIKS